jgi:hypothetical protein
MILWIYFREKAHITKLTNESIRVQMIREYCEKWPAYDQLEYLADVGKFLEIHNLPKLAWWTENLNISEH